VIVVLADSDDARGFMLAGAKTIRCRSAADVETALGAVTAMPDLATSLVLVSAAVRAIAPAPIDALLARRDAPIVLVLPETGGAG
jgi:vacuolar-type H+-ATPase subunit F/Vma7